MKWHLIEPPSPITSDNSKSYQKLPTNPTSVSWALGGRSSTTYAFLALGTFLTPRLGLGDFLLGGVFFTETAFKLLASRCYGWRQVAMIVRVLERTTRLLRATSDRVHCEQSCKICFRTSGLHTNKGWGDLYVRCMKQGCPIETSSI